MPGAAVVALSVKKQEEQPLGKMKKKKSKRTRPKRGTGGGS
jgi:hypothetical protein